MNIKRKGVSRRTSKLLNLYSLIFSSSSQRQPYAIRQKIIKQNTHKQIKRQENENEKNEN